jgi:hypothetical protein
VLKQRDGTCRNISASRLGETKTQQATGSILAESEAESILLRTGNVLQSLVELGLMLKSGPGKYDLTEEGSRVAEDLAEEGLKSVRLAKLDFIQCEMCFP